MKLTKRGLRLVAFAPLVAVLTVVGLVPTTAKSHVYATGSPTIAQHIGIPAYFPPASSTNWGPLGTTPQTYKTFNTAGGFAIANVINGPDYAANVNYDYSGTLAAEHATGTKVIGYVDTGYFGTTGLKTRLGSSSIEAWRDQVQQDVNAWYNFYGASMDGIFFDQAQNTCGAGTGPANAYRDLYAQVSQYVKDAHPGALTVINPGIKVPSCYQSAADTIVTFEGPESAYTSTAATLDWTPGDPNKIMHIVYGVPSADLATVEANSKTYGAGYIDITDEGSATSPSLYSSLPGTTTADTSYYTNELAGAASANDTTAPSAPDTVDTYDVQFTTAQLNWGPSTDNSGGSGVKAYDVYVKQGSGAYHWISSTTLASYTTPNVYLTGLTKGLTYTAYVVARDGSGNVSAHSNTVTWTQDTDTDVDFPGQPRSLSASTPTYTSTTLTWLASIGGDYSTAFYTVYDGSTQIMQLPGNVLTATIGGMTPGSSHSFKVYAIDAAGNQSPASSTVAVTAAQLPSPGTSMNSTGLESYTSTNVVFSAHVYLPFSFVRIFIDSDNNTATGFSTNGIGADYVVENGHLFSLATDSANRFLPTIVADTPASVNTTTSVDTWTIPTSNFTVAGSTFKVVYEAEGFAPAVVVPTVTLNHS